MKRNYAMLLFLCTVLAVTAGAQTIRVVNAASFLENRGLAPGSIISVLGTGLTSTTAGVSDPAHPTTSLGGVTLTIGGKLSPLFYVSPTQVNAQIDTTASAGPSTPVLLTSPTGTFTTTINVQTTVPAGIFSLSGTGTRDGAILNAVTFALGPFTVTTNGAPTFLAIYTTGLDLTAAPVVTIGGISVPVDFFGKAPCCSGLQQLNVQLTPALAGAGRVEVAVSSKGVTSNVVEVVILPNKGQGPFAPADDNTARHRELSTIAYIPGTSLALLADENDDVVRVVDIGAKKVIQTITLPEGAGPSAIAITANGKTAVVAERDLGKVAIVDLTTYSVTAQMAVGGGPGSVAIANGQAIVVNQDTDNVSIINLAGASGGPAISVGRGPRAVAVNPITNLAYVTNQDSGTISVIQLSGTLALLSTIDLPGDPRPQAIQVIPGLGTKGVAIVTVPSSGPNGQVLLVDLNSLATTAINVNPDKSGGSSDIAVMPPPSAVPAIWKVYFANQSGGSVTFASISFPSTGISFTAPQTIKVDLGARALAIDTKDNLLLITNQGSGTVQLLDLTSNKVVGSINGVQGENENDGQKHDDNSDRDHASNLPTVVSINPKAGAAGTTISTMTITGTNLTGATNVLFVDPNSLPGNGHGNGNGNQSHGPFGVSDPAFTATGIAVNSAGTSMTVSIAIKAGAGKGDRVVRVDTPNGESTFAKSPANTFTVN